MKSKQGEGNRSVAQPGAAGHTRVEPRLALPGVKEHTYFAPGWDRKKLEATLDFWDSTVAGQYAWCPRVAQYSHRMGLTQRDEALTLLTGNAGHAGHDTFYVSEDEELAVETVVQTFGAEREPPRPGSDYAHLHVGFVEAVFKNWLVWRVKHDTFKPLTVRLDDLDFTDVIAAVLRVLPDERVVLGESKLVMRFVVDGEEFVYAGKPDLPITTGGKVHILDHKWSCGGYLSDWYFEKHVISNQLRCYCRMLEVLLKRYLAKKKLQRVSGAYINGVYAGEKALETRTAKGQPSKVTKFTHYGPMLFHPSHLDEALWNQYWWQQMAYVFQEFADQHPTMYKLYGYGQNTGKSCQGCSYLPLCQTQPRARLAKIQRDYIQHRRNFLDL